MPDDDRSSPASSPSATGSADDRSVRRGGASIVVRGLAGAMAALVVAVLAVNVAVARQVDASLVEDPAAVPHRQVALVLGAGVQGDQPSPMLAQRVDAAVGLYRAGTVDHLLMSGDNGRVDYDEVTVMRDRAMAAGVPGDRVTRDFAGFDTYDSCARAQAVFGVTSAVVVTQAYHLPRAVYLCRSVGIDAVGLALPDWRLDPDATPVVYPPDLVASLQGREYLATVKAVVDAAVLRPSPRHLGPPVALGSDDGMPGEPGVPVASAGDGPA